MKWLRRHGKPLSASLLLMLLLSTSGFSMHAIYCLCKGELTYALFAPADDAAHCGSAKMDQDKASCCAPVPKARSSGSCAPVGMTCCGPDTADDHACTTEEVIYTRLATVFISLDLQSQDTPVAASGPGHAGFGPFALLPGEAHADRMIRSFRPRGPAPTGPSRAFHVLYSQFRC